MAATRLGNRHIIRMPYGSKSKASALSGLFQPQVATGKKKKKAKVRKKPQRTSY